MGFLSGTLDYFSKFSPLTRKFQFIYNPQLKHSDVLYFKVFRNANSPGLSPVGQTKACDVTRLLKTLVLLTIAGNIHQTNIFNIGLC